MREVNFSIPNVNKASVGITTALYDRRALDCTSTLPLINSLNHLAYLTTSSARIRDILTVDGGIERLVCILKQGRNGDMMSIWKWNLAFQCVVNIDIPFESWWISLLVLQEETNRTVLPKLEEVENKEDESIPPDGMELKKWEYWSIWISSLLYCGLQNISDIVLENLFTFLCSLLSRCMTFLNCDLKLHV